MLNYFYPSEFAFSGVFFTPTHHAAKNQPLFTVSGLSVMKQTSLFMFALINNKLLKKGSTLQGASLSNA
jgi:hypothetical protein